jgi:hypothetical protein
MRQINLATLSHYAEHNFETMEIGSSAKGWTLRMGDETVLLPEEIQQQWNEMFFLYATQSTTITLP